MKNYYIILILFFLSFSCTYVLDKNEEYHIIYLEKVRYDKHGKRVLSSATTAYYVGKVLIDNENFSYLEQKSAPDTIKNSVNNIFNNWKNGKTSLYNKRLNKYCKFGENGFIEAVKKRINNGVFAVIDDTLGNKIFNSNVSEDKNLISYIKKIRR